MGRFETFSNVSRRVDLAQLNRCTKQELENLLLSVVQHHGSMCE
jgi:hypothetical protein